MPKTSNLRSEVLSITQSSDNKFTIMVSVWEMPGGKNSASAVKFRFQTHMNPALWWRLSMTEAAPGSGSGPTPARYTNAQYNKALRTATDAMNALIIKESDSRSSEPAPSAASGKKMKPNRGTGVLAQIDYGTMPNLNHFLLSVSDRFPSPFAYYMKMNANDASIIERAASVGQVYLAHRDGMTTLVSPMDMYNLIDALRFLGLETGVKPAEEIAAALLGAAGFEWSDSEAGADWS